MNKRPPLVLWQLAVGYGTKAMVFFLLIVVLYPILLLSFGHFFGSVFAILITAMTYYFLMWLYCKTAKDWLGLELVKSFRDNKHQGVIRNIARTLLKYGDWAAVLILPLCSNPIITGIYLRRGSGNFERMQKRDRLIIIASSMIFSVLWISVVITGMSLYEHLKLKLARLR